MATTQTSNYSLVKPTAGTAEPVSVQSHIDDNWDKIDQDMNRFDRQIFSVTGTWNRPARAKRVIVRVVGAGGGGGGVAATTGAQWAQSGGGGGGGYAEKLFLASVLASSETVDIGAAGLAGLVTPTDGGTGGTSNFATGKAYVVSATGGGGGIAGVAIAAPTNSLGGAGGIGSGGDFNIGGGMGGTGFVVGGPAASFMNWGGVSKMSGQAPAPSASGSGTAGAQYGGGASGALNGVSQAARVGSAGAAGFVVVDSYY